MTAVQFPPAFFSLRCLRLVRQEFQLRSNEIWHRRWNKLRNYVACLYEDEREREKVGGREGKLGRSRQCRSKMNRLLDFDGQMINAFKGCVHPPGLVHRDWCPSPPLWKVIKRQSKDEKADEEKEEDEGKMEFTESIEAFVMGPVRFRLKRSRPRQ